MERRPAQIPAIVHGSLGSETGWHEATLQVLFGGSDDDIDVLALYEDGTQLLTDTAERQRTEIERLANRIFEKLMQDAPTLALLVRPVSRWPFEAAATWRVDNHPTIHLADPSFGLDGLSFAQQRWAKLAIELACRLAGEPGALAGGVLVVDEPERGLHRTAEEHLADGLRWLAESFDVCILVATHSPEIIDAPTVVTLHVARARDGRAEIRTLERWVDERRAAELGLRMSDMVLRYRTFLLVEGRHDEVALEVLLADDLAAGRVAIMRLGGANGLHGALDSQFLLRMTDARVVVVLDRVEGNAVQELWTSARRGAPKVELRAELAALAKSSPEAKTLSDFLREAVEGGDVDRVEPYGLSRHDVIEYLDVATLAPSAETWQEVRDAYRAAVPRNDRRQRSFKGFMQATYGVPINVDTVRRAAQNTDHLDDELVTLGALLRGRLPDDRSGDLPS